MAREEWRPIFDGWYAVSNIGRVKRMASGVGTWPGRIRKLQTDKQGYLCVGLSFGNRGTYKEFKVHYLVALAFIGPRPLGMDVNHKNGIKKDLSPKNLEYVSEAENVRHMVRTGLARPAFGEKHWKRKLNDGIVKRIKNESKKLSQGKLGKKYGVSQTTVWSILAGRNWKHVK